MTFQKEYLDLVLVPLGLLIMLTYHLFLLYRYLHHPHTTAFGFENNDKRAWVERFMQVEKKEASVAITVITSNISAATFLSTVSLTLSSLIGAWLGSSTNNIFESELILGDTRASTISIKYISLLSCFLLAFSCFVQSTRHFVHATYLISMPEDNVPVKYAEIAIIKVIILHYLDTNTTPLHNYSTSESCTDQKVADRIYGKATFIDHNNNRGCGLRFDLKF
ncbi:hypothetical protein AB3S75_005258 [Citrus x aurantiifolia]